MKNDIDIKFVEFHKKNPKVLKLLVKFAREVKNVGYTTYSINALFERIRWHVDIETKDKSGFKLSNNYRSRYARLLEMKYPEFEAFFRKKKLSSNSVFNKIK